MGLLIFPFNSFPDTAKYFLRNNKETNSFLREISYWEFRMAYRSKWFYKYDNVEILKNKINVTPIFKLSTYYDEYVSPDSSLKIPTNKKYISFKDIKANKCTIDENTKEYTFYKKVEQTYNLTHFDMMNTFFYSFIKECSKNNFEFDKCLKGIKHFSDNNLRRALSVKKAIEESKLRDIRSTEKNYTGGV